MKLVILGRDGTINAYRPQHIKSPDEWEALPGSLEAIARLTQAGWHVVVATNQSGLGRGLFDMSALNAVHAKMHKQLATAGGRIDAVFYCPHSPDEQCSCRKPAPGLYQQIAERYGVHLQGLHVVGDNLRDALAAQTAGCMPHVVLTGRAAILRERAARGEPLPPEFPPSTTVHENLAGFAAWLLAREAREQKEARESRDVRDGRDARPTPGAV
ncbi:MAG: D-glycero-beta-D-manno-heptose 1,7-bisphosphate 7-phosphatase [Burkholderiaceae bacterium]